jgi:hypothetical protein
MRSALKFGLLLFAFLLLVCAFAQAQAVRVNKAGSLAVTPQTAVSSLSLTASPASVTFHLVSGGIATGSSAVDITTTWGGSFCIFTCTINVYGYFTSATSALSGSSPVVDIPSSEVLGEVPTGLPTTYTAFTQSNPFGGAGASLQLVKQSFTFYTGGGSRTDALSLEINLASQPQLPAGTYSGTLYIQAQAL